jgi:hypothetical protein
LEQPGVSTIHFSNSVEWKFGDNVEWFIDHETEFLIESLGLNFVCLVNIKNLPLLICSIVVSVNTNLGSFFVFASNDFKDLIVAPVDKLVVLKLEDLPPSRVSAPDLHVIGFT